MKKLNLVLFLVGSFFINSMAFSSQCSNENELEYLMDTSKELIVGKFLAEKFAVKSENVLSIEYQATGEYRPAIDQIMLATIVPIISAVISEPDSDCGAITRGGYGLFDVSYINNNNQRCDIKIEVKGHAGLFRQEHYAIKLSANPRNHNCI